MIRRQILARRFIQLDLPAVLVSEHLTGLLQGQDRYGFHALPLVLMAFSTSTGPEQKSAVSFLELSESVCQNLHIQDMCRIWLRFLAETAEAGPTGPDAAADRAEKAIDELASLLENAEDTGLWARIFRPVAYVDHVLARKWMPYLELSIASRRTRISAAGFERCVNAYLAVRALTGCKDEVDRLFFPVKYHNAVRNDDRAEAHQIAIAWAEFRKKASAADAAAFMLLNLQRLEVFASPDAVGFVPEAADAAMAEALSTCAAYREILPEDYDLLVAQARMLRRVGNFAGCLAACAQAIALRPNGYAAYCVRSNLRFLTEEYGLARDDAEQACRLAPDKAQGFIARAFVLLHEGEYETALKDFETALRLDPQRLDAMHGRGKCLSLLGEDEEAMSCFNRLRRLLPDDPDIAYELADAMFAAGFLDDSLRVCRECLSLDETFTEAHVLMAVVETRRENDGLAFAHLERALEIESDNPFALNEMAYLLHLQGRDGEAFDYVEQALDSFPDFTEALYNKATILYFQGLLDESFELFEQILLSVPDHVSALIGKANVLTQMSELDDALTCYDEALKIFPKSSEACLGKANVYRMMGLEEDGQEWQEKARLMEQDPN